MNTLKFNDGYKELSINGDETRVIRFNPSDFGIMDRLRSATEKIEGIIDKSKDYSIEEAAAFDSDIRNIINEVFASDVCTAAFGDTNCISFAGGQPIFMNFLEAIAPVIKAECNAEKKKSAKKISKYTSQLK